MYGRIKIQVGVLSLLLCAGCEANLPQPKAPVNSLTDASSAYDVATAGEIVGRVEWSEPLPVVPPFQAPVTPLAEQTRGPKRDWPNPNAPIVDPKNRGVGNAVVFLRGVDPRRARPWDLDPVRVELCDYQMHVCQGNGDGLYGFVRRGDRIELESKQNVFQSLQARGADYFALTMPEEGTTRNRVLDHNGVVELSSNAGQFWMRAYLFVDDHPYYTRTGGDGRFALSKAPPGDYELVCWMPDWREAEHEIDADTRLVVRMKFRPPLQIVRRVHIEPGATATVDFTLSMEQFNAVTRSVP
ncbi:MAG TPA: hypothetical protein DDY78_19535 [Planctomycetales bacterium]|nr:hypothetical protein [Planctomycetales bacterium]